MCQPELTFGSGANRNLLLSVRPIPRRIVLGGGMPRAVSKRPLLRIGQTWLVTEPSLSQGPVPPAGWYRDPAHPGRQRWWDGVAWSNQVRLEAAAPSATHGNAAPTLAAGPSAAPQSGPWSSQAHGGFRPIT